MTFWGIGSSGARSRAEAAEIVKVQSIASRPRLRHPRPAPRNAVHRQNPVAFEIVDLFAPQEDPPRHAATHGLSSWRSAARARLAPRSGAGESLASSTARHVLVPQSAPRIGAVDRASLLMLHQLWD